MGEPVQVRVRDCPTGLHNGEGDWVLLAPTLSLEGGLTAEDDLRIVTAEHTDARERGMALQRRWAITFVRHGAQGWNLHDEDGTELPFDVGALLDDYGIARPVADKAADLYSEAVLRPFQTLLAARSPTGATEATTSARPGRTRKLSAQSSPAPTADMPLSTP
jgi:hypothetical protein